VVSSSMEDLLAEKVDRLGTTSCKIHNLGVIQHGFFTASRGALWKVCDSICPLCKSAEETTQHLFFHCVNVNTRWTSLLQLLDKTLLSFGDVQSPMDVICIAVKYQSRSPVRIVLVAEMLWTAWTDRNYEVFQESPRVTLLQIVVRRTMLKVQALTVNTKSPERTSILKRDMVILAQALTALTSSEIVTVAQGTIEVSDDSDQDR
jgi:hypothetical protein